MTSCQFCHPAPPPRNVWLEKRVHCIRKLEAFHHTCLRSILRISKLQRIRNVEIRRRANNVLSLESMLELRRCRWLHKVAQMPEERIPRQLFAAWHHSNRRRGRPYQTIRHGYSNTLRRLGFEGDDCNILDRWMPLARDTQRWAQRVEWKLDLQPGSFIYLCIMVEGCEARRYVHTCDTKFMFNINENEAQANWSW